MNYDHIDQVSHLLPATAQALVAAIGLPATIKLVQEQGGIEWRIPRRGKRPDGAARLEYLAEIVGQAAARELCRVFGGERITVPMCIAALRELRARDIRARFDRDIRQHSEPTVVVALARHYGLSERYVRRLLKSGDKQAPPDWQQLAMF